MIIDCHIHAGELGLHYPKWWIDELYRAFGSNAVQWTGGRPNMTVGERLLAQMDDLGIDMMCIMTSDHRRVYADAKGPYAPNDYLLKVREVAPERFALTCSVDPLRDLYEAVQEIDKCAREGFTACKLYPTYDHFYPADERLFPIYEKLIEHDMLLQVHMGWTPCLNAPMKYQMPYLLDDVAAKFPEMRILIAHMGWPHYEECMALIAKWENLHADIAYWGWFGPEYVLKVLKQFGRLCGFDKLVYGSENSHTVVGLEMMRGLKNTAGQLGIEPIPDADTEKIMWKNAARLWKIESKYLPLEARS
jgi:predicted TIM-barrel fold metal-dependent hydrolase